MENNTIIEKYNKLVEQRKKANKKYQDKISKTQEFKEKRKIYYNNNKDKLQEKSRTYFNKYYEKEEAKQKKKDYYENNKELIKIKNQYKYYLKNNNIEKFKSKFPERFKLLEENNYIINN
jgi:hypothetical protein